MTTRQKVYLALILLAAVFFRFYLIVDFAYDPACASNPSAACRLVPTAGMPGGLFPDEAANGLDIISMQQGDLQPFYERGNGREALFFYMLWGAVEIFGKGAWQHHIVSALVGLLSVLLCFLLTRRLFMMDEHESPAESPLTKTFSPNILPAAEAVHSSSFWPGVSEATVRRATNIALLAAFLMAVSTWHIALSRTAFRANLIPLFATLTFYLGICAYQARTVRRQLVLAFLTGAAFALGFYTYIAYRILVPIVAILIAWPAFGFLLSHGIIAGIKDRVAKYWKHKAVFLAGFAIFIYPLAKYFYTHPGSFVGRSGQVSVFNPELNQGNLVGAIVEVFRLSILGYFTEGDLNWRHNISGYPFLSEIVSPFFGVALVVVTLLAAWYMLQPHKKVSWWKYTLLAGWFWGMLVPVVTTAEGIPHGLRSIGTIPAVFIISAIGLYKFGEYVMQIHYRLHGIKHPSVEPAFPLFKLQAVTVAFKVLVASFCATLVLQAYTAYFVYAANSPENFYAFRSDLTHVSQYLIDRCQKDSTYLVLDKFSVQTPDYITMVDARDPQNPCNRPYIQVDPENSWELRDLKKGDQIVFTQSSIFDIKKFKAYHPDAKLTLEYRNKFGQAIMAVYEIK